MKFTVSSTALFSHLQAISRVINSKNTLPILDCFLFDIVDQQLTVTASDGENRLNTSLPVNESEGDLRFAISAKTLLDAVKEIPEQPITFDVKENYELIIQYRNGVYNIMGQNADEYPTEVSMADDHVAFEMEASLLLSGINSTLFATANDELRPVMNGIYFDITPDTLVIVASDGHKLSRKTYSGMPVNEQRASFIFPNKPASLLKSLLSKEEGKVSIRFDARNAVFTLSGFRLDCRLIEGRYPNYNSVIPKDNPFHISVDRQLLISALRRVSVFSDASSNQIKLFVESGKLTISAQDIDFSTSAQESIECEYQGESMKIGFNGVYFIETLNNIPAQNVKIELADPSRAGLILPVEQEEKSELLMLIMPMMLND